MRSRRRCHYNRSRSSHLASPVRTGVSRKDRTHRFHEKISSGHSEVLGQEIFQNRRLYIIEGPSTGGHLGFSFETLAHLSSYDFSAEVREILSIRDKYEEKYEKKYRYSSSAALYTACAYSIM